MKKVLLILLTLIQMTAFAQKPMNLYTNIPNNKPNVPNTEKSEYLQEYSKVHVSNVSVPTLQPFLAPNTDGKKKTAVIICPGGGYGILALSSEGCDIAQELNKSGISAFVLKYRLPNDDVNVDKSIAPLQDAQRALQMVREHADEWNINPNQVGIMGFSAGGSLAVLASTHYKKAYIDNTKNINLRPDFSGIIYGVVSMQPELTHEGSRINLLGEHPSKEKIDDYSGELQVTPQSPPAFLVCNQDDNAVNCLNSIAYFSALLKNKVPNNALHIYPKGGHGYGIRENSGWIILFTDWLKTIGITN